MYALNSEPCSNNMDINEHSMNEDVDADTDLCRLYAHSSAYQVVTLREVALVELQPRFFVFRL